MAVETQAPKKSKFGMPFYIAAGAALVGAAMFAYLQFGPTKPAQEIPLTPEAKGYVRNLQLADVTMKATESYLKQTLVEIQGNIGNAGDRPVSVVEIYCGFYDTSGRRMVLKRVAIVNERMGGLKPGETKAFRLAFDDIPEGWNQMMPGLAIAGVTFS